MINAKRRAILSPAGDKKRQPQGTQGRDPEAGAGFGSDVGWVSLALPGASSCALFQPNPWIEPVEITRHLHFSAPLRLWQVKDTGEQGTRPRPMETDSAPSLRRTNRTSKDERMGLTTLGFSNPAACQSIRLTSSGVRMI